MFGTSRAVSALRVPAVAVAPARAPGRGRAGSRVARLVARGGVAVVTAMRAHCCSATRPSRATRLSPVWGRELAGTLDDVRTGALRRIHWCWRWPRRRRCSARRRAMTRPGCCWARWRSERRSRRCSAWARRSATAGRAARRRDARGQRAGPQLGRHRAVRHRVRRAGVVGSGSAPRSARAPGAPLALLGVAGLIRPEAWLVAGLYWLWAARSLPWRQRLLTAGSWEPRPHAGWRWTPR